MEKRMEKMESELRVLQQAMAAVPENILRELMVRGAMLMVKAPAKEMETVVMTSSVPQKVAPAVIEDMDEDVEMAVATPAVIEDDEDDAPLITLPRGDDGTAATLVQCETKTQVRVRVEDETSMDEEEDMMQEDTTTCAAHAHDEAVAGAGDHAEEEDAHDQQSMDVETSQESATSSHSSAQTNGDRVLSLSAFDKVVCETQPVIPVPSSVPYGMQTSGPIRPLILAKRPPVIQLSQQKAQPQPVRPLAIPTPTLAPPQLAASAPAPVRLPVQVPMSGSVIVPTDFEVQTKDSVAVAWEKWCCGDASRGYPPFRLIVSKQVANKTSLRRLSDMRCAMAPVETMAKQHGLWNECLTKEEAAAAFKQIQQHLPLCVTTSTVSGRERKKEIAWSTALNNMRRGKKRKQEEIQEEEEGVTWSAAIDAMRHKFHDDHGDSAVIREALL